MSLRLFYFFACSCVTCGLDIVVDSVYVDCGVQVVLVFGGSGVCDLVGVCI